MFIPKHLIVSSLFMFVLAGTALTQEARAPIDNPQVPVAAPPLVTASVTAKRVRFVNPGTVVQLRLEVYNEAGQKVFDTELRGGNVLDWHLQDGAGERVAAGSYATVLTIKSLSGRLSQRVGVVTVNNKSAAIETARAPQLSLGQQQSIGPVEGNSAFTVLHEVEKEAITAVTHDGTDGQLTSTAGALTFRTGDVFAGKDKEHMRITEDGRVGIGTDKPEATLDVAGTVRVSDGFKFSDGTTLHASSGKLKVSDANGKATEALQGTGSENRIAKWTDNAGTLGDAAAAEVSGMTIFGQNASGQVAPLFPSAPIAHVLEVGATGNKTPMTLAGGSGVMEFWKDLGGGTASPAAAVAFGMTRPGLAATNDMVFSTFTPAANWNERMRLTTAGDLGVGTNNPGSKLDVAGNINTSTQYYIGGNRVFSIAGSGNTFAGTNAGGSNPTGLNNSFFGDSAGLSTVIGSHNSFFGMNAGRSSTSGSGNSFFGLDTGLMNTTGDFNSFFGPLAGRNNTTASNNSFFGHQAGFNNTTGGFNSFFGTQAGRNTTTGSSNSFFGQNAGFSNTTASNNSFFGQAAGFANTTGSDNSFFGINAGQANTSGGRNAFFGTSAGFANTTGSSNSFFGPDAGRNNTSGVANSFFGTSAGLQATSGDHNSFFGSNAGLSTQNGHGNSFFGAEAGRSNETGVWNSFFGGFAGHNNTGSANSFFGQSAGHDNSTGGSNAFFGNEAGSNNTTASFNSFFGRFAGFGNTTGEFNAFFGSWSGNANTTGSNNSFFGYNAGAANTGPGASGNSFFGTHAGEANSSGNSNSFFGQQAGAANTSGFGNSFFGSGAGVNNTMGSSNVAIGNGAGFLLATGNNNIYLAAGGPTDESNHIRIGGENIHTVTFIAGIKDSTVTGDAVLIDSNGQLGVLSSSHRFKQDIGAIGRASSKLMQLRPVVFHYRPEYVTGKPTLQYGLIAEEVAKVFPELVGFDADGKPQTVRYHLLNTMLLNEMQKQEGHIRSQAQRLKSQAEQIADLETRLRSLEAKQMIKGRRR